jgi:hypothetical protein
MTGDLLLRSRPRPATASARQRNSLGKQFITASRRQLALARLSLGTTLARPRHYEFGRLPRETRLSLGRCAVVRRAAPANLLFDVATCVAMKSQQSAGVGAAARAASARAASYRYDVSTRVCEPEPGARYERMAALYASLSAFDTPAAANT